MITPTQLLAMLSEQIIGAAGLIRTPLLRRLGLGAGLVAGALGAGSVAALRRPLPRTHGRLTLTGLRAPVTIIRDRWGVAHLFAQSTADLFLGQGYVHAQDRLWQMELNRRTGYGQLAEIFGTAALDADRFLRTMGFGRVARQETALVSDAAGEALEAYSAGVNLFIEQHLRWLPIEFTLLRFEPRPWHPVDSLVWAKVMALNLSYNWGHELLRARIVAAVGPERATTLVPNYPDDHPLVVPEGVDYAPHIGEQTLALIEDARQFLGLSDGPQGSNAWAIAGPRSASGRPLLAGDPHLSLQLPALWHEIHLDAPGFQVAGASLPASPGIILGHNARIAWSMTNAPVDVQDLYIERRHPDGSARYLFRDTWEPAEVVTEEIVVRGRPEPVIEEVHITRHGPVITRLVPGEEQPLAMRWTALQPSRTQEAVMGLNRARNWEDFRKAMAFWDAPPQNVVYADVDGHIGYVLAGAVPLRAVGEGQVPVPGWDGNHEWTALLSAQELPGQLDPVDGIVISANQRIVDDRYSHSLPGEWFSGYRAKRIRSLLEARPQHNPDSLSTIQGDQLSLPGLELAALAVKLSPSNPLEIQARDLLMSWDGMLSAESVAGSIYASLRYHLLRLAHKEIEELLGTVAGVGRIAWLPASHMMMRSLPGLLARLRNDDKNGLLAQALTRAVAELRATHGPYTSRWRYGNAHQIMLRHPLGIVPGIGQLLNRGPYPFGGDVDTVSMGHIPRDYASGPNYVAASYRLVCDTADWDACRSSLPGGSSGHPGSGWYVNLLKDWLTNQYHPLRWHRAQIEREAAATLVIEPPAAP